MDKNIKCQYYKYCGGCDLQEFSYKKQLDYKQEYIEKLLSKYHKVNKIIGMDNPLNYRNKVQVSFGYDDKHNIICGNYVSSTHIIVPFDECAISDNTSIKIINYLKNIFIKYHISIFDENKLKGCLRHIQIRCTSSKEYMVIFITGTNTIPKINLIINDLIKKFPNIKTIIQNINRKHTSMVLGDKNITLYGKGYIVDTLCEKKFKLSPSSFYQINKRQTEILYNTAIKFAHFNPNEVLIDAYCGIGTIGLIASRSVKKVIGVELNKQAIKDAITNMKLNKINNAYFICSDAGQYMNKLTKENINIDSVIMDPPRSGADDKFLNSLIKLKPNKILYISCGPESLRNNIKFLLKYKYYIDVIQPIDMFPYTKHVECIVLMQRKENIYSK